MRCHLPHVLAAPAAAAALVIAAVPSAAQTGRYDEYLNYEDLTGALQALNRTHPDLSALESICTTDEGRQVWLMRIGSTRGGNPDIRPAMLVVANLEANHIIGSMAALYLADYLLSGYRSADEITDLLNSRTIYLVPRLNPDGAERFWTMSQIEFAYKPNPEDEDRDGASDEDPGDDINGDGLVTMMRVRDPEGTYMVDPDEPRLMKEADRTKGERGVYKVYPEGRDDDGDGEFNEDGPGGTHLNMNWPHQYRHYADHAGTNQVSEIETRALADFAFTHRNIAAALTFSPYDNLMSAPQTGAEREAPVRIPADLDIPPDVSMEEVMEYFRERSAPSTILPQDGPYFGYISERFVEMTGLRGSGAGGEAGSWPQFAYYQLGLPSFTTPVWTLTETASTEAGDSGERSNQRARMANRSRQSAAGDDSRWLAWFDESGIRGFVDWTPANHPTLGEVEVGGFIPNVRVNPPADQISELAAKHAEFAAWLAAQTAAVTVVDTGVETRGNGFYHINATIHNDNYLPTALNMGVRNRTAPPVVARLLPAEGLRVVSGNIQQQVTVVNGSGGRSTVGGWMAS